ncbi:type I DNA topoisomerase [Candidatus Bipolaricaulota bacterium]
MKNLIIVESPTKARTIGQYLGPDYKVLSSQGHVRDLPKNELGVDVDKEYSPKFETKRTKLISELRAAASEAGHIFLATDHDREGEAIAYDLFTILNRVVKDEKLFSRLTFNEITKPVILQALKEPGNIDGSKVEAQRTRRILDRLMGYLVSPLLSRVLAGSRFSGLSAGRVQSVALKLLCDREAEISRFIPVEYWEIDAHVRNGEPFVASLARRDGEKIQIGTSAEAEAVAEEIRQAELRVTGVERKERKRNPQPPFITSTLQQAASSQLGFTPKRTMRIAQELYEGISLPDGTEGLITYMRTDSVRISAGAVAEARAVVAETYGAKYLFAKERVFENKRRSQDAHEAIRPTHAARTPDEIEAHLSADQRKLYTLIYSRFLATQMTPAIYQQGRVVVSAGAYQLEATGSTLEFDGFLRVLPDPRAKESTLPPDIAEGQALVLEEIETRQKFTEPPRRFSEAGLINLLEKEGIGRPSTYASIVSVIQEREYAYKDGGSLRPTLLGQMVVDFLRRHFVETVTPHFTAHLEEDLDQIEEGEMTRVDALSEFYKPFAERLEALDQQIEEGSTRVFQVPTDVACEVCGAPMELRYWKGSHFLGCSSYPECKNTVNLPPNLSVVYGDDLVEVKEALESVAESAEPNVPCAECGHDMEMRTGRYGRYYKCTSAECGKTAPVSTGVPCPSCGEGVMVEKYSGKRRRTFYSCDRYPDCRYAVSDKPIKACPACGSGVLVEKDGELRCTTKECDHTEPVEG